MKFLYLSNYLYQWLLIATCLISVATMTGCGAGGDTIAGAGSGGTGVVAKQISGTVADGYLVNATVFLDKNGNYQLDAGEPSATTDANGAYTLSVDPADVGKYPIVVLAIKGVTIDKDTNQTLASSYVLSLPKDSISSTVSNNFISPMTSLVREMMETGLYASMQQAMDALGTKMGLPAGTNLMTDYIAANNTTMHTAAQNIATLMGNQMGLILGTSGSTITVDVNRYRSMMGTIFSNMSSIMGSNAQTGMTNLNSIITTMLTNMPTTSVGQPFMNMSTSFRSMMVVANTTNSGMR
jgi:hypothetical protein